MFEQSYLLGNFVAYSQHNEMVGKSLLNDLIKSYDLDVLEKHLIFCYNNINDLDFERNLILAEYFKEFALNEELYLNVLLLEINTIKDLEHCLEILIPKNDRKFNGAYFTPDYIVDFIINEIKPELNDKNLDPSCGCGAFLIGLIDYYRRTYFKSIKNTIKENIFGSDILDYNIKRAKLLLTIYALQNNETIESSDFNLFCQDSLKATWELNFDNVVGNPPYVRFQDLSTAYREYLAKNWMTVSGGTFNLYFAFFELGYQLLKPTGKLGYITPNNYFTSLSGEAIRVFFQEKRCVSRVIDFTHRKIFDAQTYTALTFLNKKVNDAIKFDRITDSYDPEYFLTIVNGSLNYLKDLKVKKWRLLKSDEQQNIKTIESIGTPIGKLFEICVGVATLKDEIFFVDSSKEKGGCYIKTTDKGTFLIEKEITKPVYKISDFKTQDEIGLNTRRIICPYRTKGKNPISISETDLKLLFPNCYEYFNSEKETLAKRDKGKGFFEPFFAWGRTQGLSRTGRKILNPTFSKSPRFLLVNEEDSYFTNGYGIYPKWEDQSLNLFDQHSHITNIENLAILQKILNSYVMDYYVTKTSVSIEGGYPCYQKNFIENFSIPDFTKTEIKCLDSLIQPHEIDDFLIKKYQLNISRPNRLS